MDRETRRIIIGVVIFALGLTLLEVSGYYQRLALQQLQGQNAFCEGSNCLTQIIIQGVSQIGGSVIAFVGVIIALIATFRKIGQP